MKTISGRQRKKQKETEELQINVRQPFEPIGTGNTALDADKFYESDYKLNPDELKLG